MKNILGRDIPDYIEGYGPTKIFEGAYKNIKPIVKTSVRVTPRLPLENKVVDSIEEVLDKLTLRNGMCISFHHHLRNGDNILNRVVTAIQKRGIRDITIAASAIFPVHEPLVQYIEDGTVTKIYSNYISGPEQRLYPRGDLSIR